MAKVAKHGQSPSTTHLRGREVSHAFHCSMLGARNLVTGRLAHRWGVGPIVLACQHVDWALLRVNVFHSGAPVL